MFLYGFFIFLVVRFIWVWFKMYLKIFRIKWYNYIGNILVILFRSQVIFRMCVVIVIFFQWSMGIVVFEVSWKFFFFLFYGVIVVGESFYWFFLQLFVLEFQRKVEFRVWRGFWGFRRFVLDVVCVVIDFMIFLEVIYIIIVCFVLFFYYIVQ